MPSIVACPGGRTHAGLSCRKRPVQVGAGCNQRKMGKGLGEVPECPACRADLLGIETNVIALVQQSRWSLCRGDQPDRRGTRELPPGLYPSCADYSLLPPGPGACGTTGPHGYGLRDTLRLKAYS